jgi:tetratricopeptide (TPR) repeat protein
LYLVFPTASRCAELDPLLEEGLEAHKVGNCKKAVEIYTEYLKAHKKSPDALNWRGMCYDDLGQPKKALADYDLAIRISPKHSELYNNRGEIYRNKKQYKRALADYRKAVVLEPDFAEPHYNMGLVYEAQGHFRAAMKQYLAYLKANPDVKDAREVLVRIQAVAKKGPGTKAPKPRAVRKPPPRRTARADVKTHRPPRSRMPGLPPGVKMPPGMKGVPQMPNMEIMGFDMTPVFAWMMKAQQEGTLSLYTGIANIASYLFFGITLFFIGRKTGAPMPWLAFVPIASLYVLVKSAGKAWWWMLLLFIPLVNIVIWILTSLGIARERRKSVVWGVLLIIPCTMPIALIYLAFSK